MTHPTPDEIKSARIAAGLTQKQAGNLVGIKNARDWQRFETAVENKNHRIIPIFKWELFLLKINNSQ